MSIHSNKFIALALVCLLTISASAQSSKSTAGPLPNANQLRWQDMEMYALSITRSIPIPTRSGALAMRIQSSLILRSSIVGSGLAYVDRLACVALSLLPSIIVASACGRQSIRSIA